MTQGVLEDVREDAVEQAGVGDDVARGVVEVPGDAIGCLEGAHRGCDDLGEVDLARVRDERAGLQP